MYWLRAGTGSRVYTPREMETSKAKVRCLARDIRLKPLFNCRRVGWERKKRFLRVRCMVTRRVFLCPLGRILLVGTARRENEERSHRKRDKRTRKRIRIWSWFPEAAIWLLSKEVPRNSLELRSRLGMMPTCMSCALPRGRVSLTSVLRTICWNVSAWSKTHQVVLTFFI